MTFPVWTCGNQIEAEFVKGFQELYLTGAVQKRGVHRENDGQNPEKTNAALTKSD
jgi:hypothetical protein